MYFLNIHIYPVYSWQPHDTKQQLPIFLACKKSHAQSKDTFCWPILSYQVCACQLKLFKLNSAQKFGKLSNFYHLSFASVNIHRLFHSPNFTSAIKQLLKYLEQHICNIKFSRSDEKECTGQTLSFRFLRGWRF